MKSKLNIEPKQISKKGEITFSLANLKLANNHKNLWYKFPASYESYVSPNADPFVLATLLYAMRESSGIMVHGSVSPSLLKNLSFLQEIWNTWNPTEYKIISIEADEEKELPKLDGERFAISSFSGGVDSCYTVMRHQHQKAGRLQEKLTTGLILHGLDIPLSDMAAFEAAALKSQSILESTNMSLIRMSTNWREVIKVPWEDGFGTAVASAMMMLQGHFQIGLVASGQSYANPRYPWGSTPLTDKYYSSGRFEVIYDGASHDRFHKIKEINHWPEALEHLRVCWQGENKDSNCCECEKCVRTLLSFKVLDEERPLCFSKDVSNQQIRRLKIRGTALNEMSLVCSHAQKEDIKMTG
jgi:hypothetical protein